MKNFKNFRYKLKKNLNNQDIKIYCRNNDKELPAYFDDLEIERFSK